MPSVGEVSRTAKDNLRHSLAITRNLTVKSSDPSDFVVHRMNEVLRAVTDSCFDSSSMESVDALYRAIGEVQHLVANTHELALVNLSRSFAVVLEEAIKIKGKLDGRGRNNNNNNNNNNTSASSGGPWGNTAQISGIDSMRPSSGSSHSGRTIYRRSQSVDVRARSALLTAAALPLSHGSLGKPAVPRASAAAAAASVAEAARRKEKEEKKDYSPEAIKGRVKINNISTTVTELQLRGHFEQIGEILSISYPIRQGKHTGRAYLKFKDNETADEVCRRVNGTNLGGAPLMVERAKYWYKKDPPPVFGTGRANAGSGPGAGADSKMASSSPKIDTDEVD